MKMIGADFDCRLFFLSLGDAPVSAGVFLMFKSLCCGCSKTQSAVRWSWHELVPAASLLWSCNTFLTLCAGEFPIVQKPTEGHRIRFASKLGSCWFDRCKMTQESAIKFAPTKKATWLEVALCSGILCVW